MSNVFEFPQRAKPAEVQQDAPVDAGPAPTVPTEPSKEVQIMLTESAAMVVIATLSFYASQGWDGGRKARAAMPALQELLATKGIKLVLPPA